MSDNDGPNYDETFFVLGELQDIFYFASLVISGLGVILCCLTSFIYFKKEHKQSKDIYSCALAFCDALCNATGVLFTLSRLSSWGYTHLSCVSVIYLWRAIPTLSWALVLSIAVTRYFAVIKYDFFKRNFSKKVVAVNMIGIVVFSLIAAIPFPLECNRVINVTDAELKGATRPQPGLFISNFDIFTDCQWGAALGIWDGGVGAMVSQKGFVEYTTETFFFEKRKRFARKQQDKRPHK